MPHVPLVLLLHTVQAPTSSPITQYPKRAHSLLDFFLDLLLMITVTLCSLLRFDQWAVVAYHVPGHSLASLGPLPVPTTAFVSGVTKPGS